MLTAVAISSFDQALVSFVWLLSCKVSLKGARNSELVPPRHVPLRRGQQLLSDRSDAREFLANWFHDAPRMECFLTSLARKVHFRLPLLIKRL